MCNHIIYHSAITYNAKPLTTFSYFCASFLETCIPDNYTFGSTLSIKGTQIRMVLHLRSAIQHCCTFPSPILSLSSLFSSFFGIMPKFGVLENTASLTALGVDASPELELRYEYLDDLLSTVSRALLISIALRSASSTVENLRSRNLSKSVLLDEVVLLVIQSSFERSSSNSSSVYEKTLFSKTSSPLCEAEGDQTVKVKTGESLATTMSSSKVLFIPVVSSSSLKHSAFGISGVATVQGQKFQSAASFWVFQFHLWF